MYEFEKHQRLTEFIQEMANTGKAPQEWTSFIETLNQALRIHDVSGRSEQLSCGRNITTCVFYEEGGKCSNLEYCRDQTT